MKQVQKKDAILRYLYEKRDDRKGYSIRAIFEELSIETNDEEISRIAEDLVKDRYIELKDLSSRLKKARITGRGVEYCEADSYAHKGSSIINNYTITNSPNANIVVDSSQVSINQSQQEKAVEIIRSIREVLRKEATVQAEQKQEILECLTEIENGIEAGKQPKYALRSLLTMTSEVASIAGFGMNLFQVLTSGLPH